MSYHSTGIRLAMDHCPAALDFHERREERYDRRGFETGIAAHAVLEAVGRETESAGEQLDDARIESLTASTCRALIAEGREYDGEPEPPLHPDAVFAGRDLADKWLWAHPIQPRGARYEVGLAVNTQWEPVAYDSDDAWIACIVDVVAVEDYADEESAGKVLIVGDYKTSWAADDSELQTLQRKIQAVLSDACLPEAREADAIRLEVHAVRRLKTYSEEILTHHGGRAKLNRWRRDIGTVVNELGALLLVGNGARPARPGPGCIGCPWLHQCGAAQLYHSATGLPDDPKERARAWSVAVATVDSLRPLLEQDAGRGAIHLDDRERVGWQSTPSSEPADHAGSVLAELWADHLQRPEIAPILAGLLKAVGAPTATAIRKALKTVYPERDDADARAGYELAMLQPVNRRKWSAWKEEE